MLNILSSITGQLFCVGNMENSYDILFRLESFLSKKFKSKATKKDEGQRQLTRI